MKDGLTLPSGSIVIESADIYFEPLSPNLCHVFIPELIAEGDFAQVLFQTCLTLNEIPQKDFWIEIKIAKTAVPYDETVKVIRDETDRQSKILKEKRLTQREWELTVFQFHDSNTDSNGGCSIGSSDFHYGATIVAGIRDKEWILTVKGSSVAAHRDRMHETMKALIASAHLLSEDPRVDDEKTEETDRESNIGEPLWGNTRDYCLRLNQDEWTFAGPYPKDGTFVDLAGVSEDKRILFSMNITPGKGSNLHTAFIAELAARARIHRDFSCESIRHFAHDGHYTLQCVYTGKSEGLPISRAYLWMTSRQDDLYMLLIIINDPGGCELYGKVEDILSSFRVDGKAKIEGQQYLNDRKEIRKPNLKTPRESNADKNQGGESQPEISLNGKQKFYEYYNGIFGLSICLLTIATLPYAWVLLLKILPVVEGHWPAADSFVNQAWWSLMIFVVAAAALRVFLVAQCFSKADFKVAHSAEIMKEIRSGTIAFFGVTLMFLSIGLMIGFSWFFAILLVLVILLMAKCNGDLDSDPAKVMKNIRHLPQNLRNSVESIEQISKASTAIADKVISFEEAQKISSLDDYFERIQFLQARTCPICMTTSPDRELPYVCQKCGKAMCANCRVQTRHEIVLCSECHKEGAVCHECGTYFKNRLSLYSCAACSNHFCENCARVYDLPVEVGQYLPGSLDPVSREIRQPYLGLSKGPRPQWVLICRRCEERHRENGPGGETRIDIEKMNTWLNRFRLEHLHCYHENTLRNIIRENTGETFRSTQKWRKCKRCQGKGRIAVSTLIPKDQMPGGGENYGPGPMAPLWQIGPECPECQGAGGWVVDLTHE